MLTVQVFDDSGNPNAYLDLYEDSPISLNKRFQNLADVNSAQGSFTQTFRVPATLINRQYFGAYFDLNVTGGFNAKRRRKCVLGTSGMTILEGSIQLVACYIQAGQHHEYECTVYGETSDLAANLKGVQLSDIDLSTYDHIQSTTQVLAAFSTAGLSTGSIRYAFVDRGFGWQNQLTPIDATPENIVVMLRLDKVVEKILDHAGYELSGSFFASGGTGQDVYMSFTRGGLTNEYAGLEEYGLRAAIDGAGAQSIVTATQGGFTTIEFVSTPISGEAGLDTGDVYDFGSNYDDTTHRYTAPFTGTFTFTLNIKINSITTGGAGYFVVYDVTEGSGAVNGQSIIYVLTVAETQVFTLTPNLIEGNEYEIRWQGYTTNPDPTILPQFAIDGTGDDRSFVLLTQSNEAAGGLTFQFSRNSPEVSALDVLRGVQSAFNLLFIPTATGFRLESAQTYLYSGDLLDWSDKVDYSKDVVITPTSDQQYAEYEFSHGESQDILGVAFQESGGRRFGRYKIRDSENDFATGSFKIDTGFHPWMDYVSGLDQPFMMLIGPDGEPLDNMKPMLAFFAGQITGFSVAITFGDGTLGIPSGWAYFSNCDTIGGGPDAKLLTFGQDTVNATIAANMPTRTLYRDHWQQYFTELYSAESRIVECEAFLTPADVATLNWNDEIVIREGHFRVLSIDGYTANGATPTRLKLLRRIGDPYQECDYTITSITGGVVLFEDADGNTGFGNESCCVEYGYYWTGSKCQTTPPSTGRTNSQFFAPSNTIATLSAAVTALQRKVAHIFGTDSGVDAIIPTSGSEIISADAVKEETDRKFATTSQLTSITDSANEIVDLRRILKTEDEDKLGVFSDITDETAPSLEVDNTANTAVVRSSANTGITADQSAVPGTVTVSVQAYNGTGGSEASVDAITVTGSSADPSRATVSIGGGDFRVPSPTQFSSTVNFTALSTATFQGSTSGIDYNDLDNLPAAGTPLASADQTLTADRTIDGGGSHDLIVKNPTDFKVTNSASATVFSVVPGSPGTVQVNGNFSVDSAQVTGGSIKLEEANLLGSNYIELKAPISVTSNVTLTFPDGAGSSGQVLQSNGSGTLTWTDRVSQTNPLIKGALTIERITVGNTPKIYIKGEDNLAGVVLQAPEAISTDVTFTLPETDGTSGQVLQTDGSGNLSFATAGGGSSAQTVMLNYGFFDNNVRNVFVPLTNETETTSRQRYNVFVPTSAGEVKKFSIFVTGSKSGGTGGSIAVQKMTGATSYTTLDTATFSSLTGYSPTVLTFSGATFSAGDRIYFFFTNGFGSSIGNMMGTIEIEYS